MKKKIIIDRANKNMEVIVEKANKTKKIAEKDIVSYLDSLNMKHSLKGFKYLIEAISGSLEGKYNSGICNMYSDIAKKFDTTGSRVERAIRHCIKECGSVNANNSEFIAKSVDKFLYD